MIGVTAKAILIQREQGKLSIYSRGSLQSLFCAQAIDFCSHSQFFKAPPSSSWRSLSNLASGDAHEMDGVADDIGGALFSAWPLRHAEKSLA